MWSPIGGPKQRVSVRRPIAWRVTASWMPSAAPSSRSATPNVPAISGPSWPGPWCRTGRACPARASASIPSRPPSTSVRLSAGSTTTTPSWPPSGAIPRTTSAGSSRSPTGRAAPGAPRDWRRSRGTSCSPRSSEPTRCRVAWRSRTASTAWGSTTCCWSSWPRPRSRPVYWAVIRTPSCAPSPTSSWTGIASAPTARRRTWGRASPGRRAMPRAAGCGWP